MKKIILTISILTGIAGTAVSQERPDPAVPQGENLQVPEGWEFRLDSPDENISLGADPDKADIYFVNMTPGWHVTTGPRAIFYHPANLENGNYSIHTALHLFDPKGRNREGYGLFFGGQDLQGADVEYLYFLIRNTGDFLVKARMGEETETIQGWTASELINRYDENTESSVLNTLGVDVTDGIMSFFINGTKVSALEVGNWGTDGIFGLRVNHNVNLHVEDLGTGLE